MRAVERYAADLKPNFLVQLGDFNSFDCISSHNKTNLRAVAKQTIQHTYDIGNHILDRWQVFCPEIIILEGNHDYRVERYIDEHPATEGKLEVVNGLHLIERGIKWVPYWSKGTIYKRGKVRCGHGKYVNDHHAKKHVSAYQHSLFYGHTHDVQLYSIVTMGDGETRVGQSCGCLCRYNQDYMLGSPDRWQQAFVKITLLTNGNYFANTVMIFNHAFVSPEGIYYDGRRS